MLQAWVLNFGGGWYRHLGLAEFADNNSYQASIQMASFEALYGRRCRSALYWSDVGERTLGPDLLQEAEEKDILIRRHLETAQSRQRNYAILGDETWSFRLETVFPTVSSSRGIRRFGVRGKLNPRFI